MIQPDPVERVEPGDPEAIALLLNRNLQPRGVTAKVLLRKNALQILLISNRVLNQHSFVAYIQKQLGQFNLEAVQTVKIYGQQLGEEVPNWYQEFQPTPPDTSATAPNQLGRAARSDTNDFLSTLKTFQFSAVFPYREVLSADLYRNPTVKLLLFFGLFPLAVDLIDDRTSLGQMAWLLGIYYASIWGLVLYNLIKPAQFSWSNTLKCVFFTAFVGIPLLLLFQQVPPFNALYAAIRQGMVARIFGFVLGVGVLEELCKALPVYLFLLRPHKLDDPLISAFYGSMSGLGFAIAEGATYSLIYGFGLSQGKIGLGSFVVANTIRFVSLPLFHAILAGIVGYFMGLAAINPSRQGAIIFIGVAIAAALHGLYNSFAGGPVGLIIIGFSILLFVIYLRRSKQMVDQMHQAEQSQRSASKTSLSEEQ